MRKLYEPLPKVAGIAVDLYFDHILAKNGINSTLSLLDEFIDEFYAASMENEEHYSERFKYMIDRMKERNWLYQYQFEYGLMKACKGVSSRISFPNVLIQHTMFSNFMKKRLKKHFLTSWKMPFHIIRNSSANCNRMNVLTFHPLLF